jgi:ER lumen protein retaining receptor
LYRALYIPNWIWRYFAENGWFDVIAVVAGLVQTVLYSDFFWIYYTKYASTTGCINKFHNMLIHRIRVLQGKKFNLPV